VTALAGSQTLPMALLSRAVLALQRPRGTRETGAVLRMTGILALLALPAVLYLPSAAGLTVFVLLTIWVNGPLSPFLPLAYEPLLIIFGQQYAPLLIAALGTMGTLFVECINYRLHGQLLRTSVVKRIVGGRGVQWVTRQFAQRPAFTVWLCAWSPLPYWPVRILSPLTGLKMGPHLLATMLGRFPLYLLVATVGGQLDLNRPLLIGIAGGTAAIAALAWVWRSRRSFLD
jgi:membrane protein YqaA with SNARE-associated domain